MSDSPTDPTALVRRLNVTPVCTVTAGIYGSVALCIVPESDLRDARFELVDLWEKNISLRSRLADALKANKALLRKHNGSTKTT